MGRKVVGLKKAFKNVASKEVEGNTVGELLQNLDLQYTDVAFTINVLNKAGTALSGSTIVLKTGSTQDAGDAVSATSGSTYPVHYGSYNYAISKANYETEKGIIVIGYDEARAGEASLDVTLLTFAQVTVGVKNSGGEAIDTPVITVKKGATPGSGDEVTAVNGKYPCLVGTYNYNVSKADYETETGTFVIAKADLETEVALPIVLLTFAVVNLAISAASGPVEGTTVVIKKGAEIGSGEVVAAEVDETYNLLVGDFNYSVAKDTYTTKTGTFAVLKADLETTKEVAILIVLAG